MLENMLYQSLVKFDVDNTNDSNNMCSGLVSGIFLVICMCDDQVSVGTLSVILVRIYGYIEPELAYQSNMTVSARLRKLSGIALLH